jgi:hypothetical protein
LQMGYSLCKRKTIICKSTDFIRENGNNRPFLVENDRISLFFHCRKKFFAQQMFGKYPTFYHRIYY